MLKIGLTGGIGSGKSLTSSFLDEIDAYIFDADAESRKLLENNDTLRGELIAEFGMEILDKDGDIDRKSLARIAFQDEEHQQILNATVHPYIIEEMVKQFADISVANKHSMFVVDGALIYESGIEQRLDYTVVVTSLLKNRLSRALARGNLTREDILKRMSLQWGDDEKVALADYVIRNDGSEEDLKKLVIDIFTQFIE